MTLASVIGEEELSPSDKRVMEFGRAFEEKFVGQGNTCLLYTSRCV